MTYGVQRIAKALGADGCYFLSLLKIAESIAGIFVDPIMEAAEAIENGTMDKKCYINDPVRLIEHITRIKHAVVKTGPEYLPRTGEREILRYERPDLDNDGNQKYDKDGKPIMLSHFVVGDGQGRCAWDPWPDSLTVARGTLISKRIIRRVS